jgi:hypothetical protein
MDYSLFETAASEHIDKFKEIIGKLPIEQQKTYMNVAADIPLSDFYMLADEIRRNNNISVSEEYKAKINSLVSDITFELFEYCKAAK